MKREKIQLLRRLGMHDKADLAEAGRCVECGKAIHPNLEFEDNISVKEYGISGLCQECQNIGFARYD